MHHSLASSGGTQEGTASWSCANPPTSMSGCIQMWVMVRREIVPFTLMNDIV